MKSFSKRTSLKVIAIIALAVIAAVACSVAGHPIIDPSALAGMSMLPVAMGSTQIQELNELIEKQNTSLIDFKARNVQRMDNIEQALNDFLKKSNRPAGIFDGGFSSADSEHRKSFFDYMRTGTEHDLREKKAMVQGSLPDGGFLVPSETDNIVTKNLRDTSAMRQLATVVAVGKGSDFTQLHSVGGTGSSWVGETTARTATATPQLKAINIPVHECYSSPQITQNLLDDATFNLEAWLVQELSEAFGDAEGAAFITGDGVSRPRGICTIPTVATGDATRSQNEFQYIPTGASGAFHTDQCDPLIKLVYAVKPQYRQNGSWLVSPEVLEAVRKLKDGHGSYLWQPSLGVGQPSMLLGYPVFEDANLPAIAANSLSAAFGDFARAYTIVDRSTTILRDPFSQKPYVSFYTSRRVGGGPGRDTRAVKFLKFAAS